MVNSRHERGQLVLIAAILVATAILGAVVLLNAVHSSPNVKAQSDAQSLADTDQMTEQIHRHVRKLFFATSTSDGEKQQPYAEIGALRSNVTAYNSTLGPFVSREKPTVTDVTYDPASSSVGGFVAGDAIPQRGFTERYINGTESLPYLNVTVAEDAGVVINLYNRTGPTPGPTPEQRITLDGEDTAYETVAGTGTCSDVGPEPDPDGEVGVTVELERRSGEIRDKDGDSCEFTFEEMSQYDVQITTTGPSTVDGSFAVSGKNPTSVSTYGSPSVRAESPVIVNPRVQISYQTPSVAYDSEYTLFTEADR